MSKRVQNQDDGELHAKDDSTSPKEHAVDNEDVLAYWSAVNMSQLLSTSGTPATDARVAVVREKRRQAKNRLMRDRQQESTPAPAPSAVVARAMSARAYGTY